MKSIFLRSLSVASAHDAACVTQASRTPADGTFAIARCSEGVIQVYAASCAALLHEFSTIHPRVLALQYTSFSDSLVTLESNRASDAQSGHDHGVHIDEEIFLCVYHDWRERTMVRAYTLPLGVLDVPSSKRVSDCFAVCSYSGRVVVAMGSMLNIWQCSRGFFEHVMELKVDMAQNDAYHVVQFVAIHGINIAYASSTEIRVMEVHVRSAEESTGTPAQVSKKFSTGLHVAHHQQAGSVDLSIESDDDCVTFSMKHAVDDIDAISIPLASYGEANTAADKSVVQTDGKDEAPIVLGNDEAQEEVFALAGLVRSHDVRVNQAMGYFVAESDIRVILRRYLPPNQHTQGLQFLPETMDDLVSPEARSYSRLLVSTRSHAFLYYFISSETDVTRKRMQRKVLGRGRSQHIQTTSDSSSGYDDVNKAPDAGAGSMRVVMHYAFAGEVSCIAANSSFLFVATASSLQVWSIWSPCYTLAKTRRTMLDSVKQEPTQPQLLSVQPLSFQVSGIVALDSFVVLAPLPVYHAESSWKDLVRLGAASAPELSPRAVFEMRSVPRVQSAEHTVPAIVIYQQSPPTAIFSMLQQEDGLRPQARIDLLLSLYSLYRYRADVGSTTLSVVKETGTVKPALDARATMGLQLETAQYHRLACECALTLARIFSSDESRDLERAVFFYISSNLAPSRVVTALEATKTQARKASDDVGKAVHDYIQACAFVEPSRPLTTVTDHAFTMVAVAHFANHAPQDLIRLIISSTLTWSLADLSHATELLEGRSSIPQLYTARLMLILRTLSVSPVQWDACHSTNRPLWDRMRQLGSADTLHQAVDGALRSDKQALIHLCVGHPNLLVDTTDPASCSLFADTLRALAPHTLLEILVAVFQDAVRRREPLAATLSQCLRAIGDAARPCVARFNTPGSDLLHNPPTRVPRAGVIVLLHVLCHVLDEFPRLHLLAERDELNEDEDELQRMRRFVATEFVQLCVALCSFDWAKSEAAVNELLTSTPSSRRPSLYQSSLPEWELEYVNQRCIPTDSTVGDAIQRLLERTLELVHEPELLVVKDLLALYETNAVNDMGVLLVLLALPYEHRTIDALRMLAQRDGFLDLFLPYGKNHCTTLDEWKFLIETLASMGETGNESTTGASHDELGVLESVLHHVCSTLGPDELLQVLPDDGDLALFMSTLEASVRLEDMRAQQERRATTPNGLVASC